MNDAPVNILLVEDNPAEARLLRETLVEVGTSWFELTHAERLGEAQRRLREGSFDVILLDLSLPDSQGPETLARMYERASGVPIVVLTGLDDEAVAVRAVQDGAQDYLLKGEVGGGLLVRAIRYAIERKRAEESLRRAHDGLEVRVRERTAELERANETLVAEVTERKRAEAQVRGLNAHLERRLRRSVALRRIDMAITSSLDLRLTLGVILDQVAAQLHVDAAAVLLCDPHSHALGYAAGTGFRTDGIVRSRLRPGEGWAGRAAVERRTITIRELSEPDEPFVRAPLVAGESFTAYSAVPLVAKGQVKGVLELFHRAPPEADSEWLDFLEALASQAAIAVDNAALFENLQRSNAELTAAYDATIEGWSRALDLRDKETEGHSRRVTEMTLRLAHALGLGEADLVHMRRGALLHDIGKMGIPDGILLKPGPLTDEEWRIMRRHPTYAYEWLRPIPFLRRALEIPHGHHEKWDGSGYPRGLKGEQIPLSARIFAAVDIWDALRTDRPYRPSWPEEKVWEHIRSLAGTHLDPEVVATFLKVASAESPVCDPLAIATTPDGCQTTSCL